MTSFDIKRLQLGMRDAVINVPLWKNSPNLPEVTGVWDEKSQTLLLWIKANWPVLNSQFPSYSRQAFGHGLFDLGLLENSSVQEVLVQLSEMPVSAVAVGRSAA